MRNLIGTLVVLFLSLLVRAQDKDLARPGKTSFTDSVWSIYQSARGENLAIFQGRQIMSGYPGITGTAFYPHTEWLTGDVKYEGYWYRGLEMLYDTYRDELMVRHQNGIPFVAFGDRVQEFNLQGHRFVRLDTDRGSAKAGFYEVIADGELVVYVKRAVFLNEGIQEQTIVREFIRKPRYYAQLGNQFVAINKQGQIMDLVKSKRSQVQQAVRASGLKFRKFPEAVIKIIADTYNQSTR